MARIVYNSNDEFYIQCEHCGRQIAYYEDEVEDGAIICPNCEEEIYVDPAKKPFVWPGGFHHCSVSNEAVKLPDEKVQVMVSDMLAMLKKDKVGEFELCATGDTLIIGFRFEDEIQIYVTKDYYEQYLSI